MKAGRPARVTNEPRLPLLCRSGEIKEYGTAERAQNLQVPTHSNTCTRAGVGNGLASRRTLYYTALEQRKTWWERGQGKNVTYHQQKVELPDVKAACPEYAEVNAQVTGQEAPDVDEQEVAQDAPR